MSLETTAQTSAKIPQLSRPHKSSHQSPDRHLTRAKPFLKRLNKQQDFEVKSTANLSSVENGGEAPGWAPVKSVTDHKLRYLKSCEWPIRVSTSSKRGKTTLIPPFCFADPESVRLYHAFRGSGRTTCCQTNHNLSLPFCANAESYCFLVQGCYKSWAGASFFFLRFLWFDGLQFSIPTGLQPTV